MECYNTAYIKAIRPLEDELLKYGIEPDSHGFAECPFHNEKTASFKVYSDGTFHCFGCGVHGDVIDLTMKMQNVDFNTACEILGGDIKYSQMRKADEIAQKKKRILELIKKTNTEYFYALDDLILNEIIIKALRPKSPEDTPLKMWLDALNKRSYLLHRLDCFENKKLKLRQKGVAN